MTKQVYQGIDEILVRKKKRYGTVFRMTMSNDECRMMNERQNETKTNTITKAIQL